MESTNRSRGRKRYCCCYCNVYFYQIDSWQRHNRKHTGVEIECDDCGEMCSDSFELKSHQQLCEAYRVYSEELFTDALPGADDKLGKEPAHETPDSTSKQELSNDTEEGQTRSPWSLSRSRENDGETSPVTSVNEDSNKNSELDDLIGEDREAGNAMEVSEEGRAQEDNDDPETEALIGLDETVSSIPKSEEAPTENREKPNVDNSVGVDSQVVIKVDSALNEAKRMQHKLNEPSNRSHEGPSFLNRPTSAQPVNDNMQVMSLENSELNKKYQPYFCKNCGARFTRKDSVTRHLKKGTCSGKSAIVCSICGKVFPELFELQQHFKLDHKNVLLAPTLVTHRTILPKPSEHSESGRPQHFTSYPPFVLRDQHHPPVSRPLSSSDSQQYRSLPPHGIFYPSSSGQSSYRHGNNYPNSNQGSHYRDQHYQSSRQYDLKYSPGGLGRKDGLLNDKTLMSRKRVDYNTRDPYSEREDAFLGGKRNKLDYEHEKPSYHRDHSSRVDNKNQINLSEYTNNAMNSQQYFSKRFVQKESSSAVPPPPPGGTDNESTNQVHQCKICGNEFPRFEYLLTHLRKHKEKPEQEDDTKESHHHMDTQGSNNTNNTALHSPVEVGDNRSSSFDSLPKTVYGPNHEAVTVVVQQPPKVRYPEGNGVDNYLPPVDAPPIYSMPPPPSQAGVIGDTSLEAITPGVDGKFRPFICENCGQRFTRKDSLVRHAKKQTCYEEQTDLKCKHCDKTFRYHKCLFQHQELVHGVSREEQAKNHAARTSEDDDTDSDERSEKNDSSSTDGKKYRSPTHPDSMSQLKTFQPTSAPLPRSVGFAGTPFAQLEQPNPPPSTQVPKFIPPRVEEKIKSGLPVEGNPPPPSSGNAQDAQYIGYCTVPRPFQCEYCGDRFAHRHSLKRHIRRHLGIGIPCHECGKLYRDQSEWRRHQRSIHNRHYEKYEVPSRISFRDGVENGMIGIVQNSEYNYENNDGSDSEKSDEEISMVKKSSKNVYLFNNNNNNNKPMDGDTKKLSEVTNQTSDELREPDVSAAEEERSPEKLEDKENKQGKQAFNFKLHMAGDKDSRKSALDRYLRSSNSDEEGDDAAGKDSDYVMREEPDDGGLETSEMKETGIEPNNNNLVVEMNKKGGSHDNTLPMTMVGGAQV